MNTENNQTLSVVDQAKRLMQQMFAQLDTTTGDIPINILLRELQIVIERLTFHDLTRTSKDPMTVDDVHLVLAEDISPGVMQFMEWVATRNILRLFVGNNGQFLLSYSSQHYKEVPEVIFSTPTALQSDFQASIAQRLREVHPLPARVIFRVAPSLMVGCLISTPTARYDYSLKRTALDNISRYSQRQFSTLGGARG